MIPEYTTLYPQYFTADQMYYDDQPFAYWACAPEYNFYEWVLYKEYNNYRSVCNPNDCLQALSYEEVINSLKTYSFYEDFDREKLCKSFRQKSLFMSDEEAYYWEDFVE